MLFFYACKKEVKESITLLAPANNTTGGIQPVFKWTGFDAGPAYTLYLSSTYPYTQSTIPDSIVTDSTHFAWDSVLPYGVTYYWHVKSGNTVSATDSFFTGYPDSMFTGTYYVNEYYQVLGYDSIHGPYPIDSNIGNENITITEVRPGTLQLTESSLTHKQFSDPYTVVNGNEILYLGFPISSITFTGNTVNAFNGYSAVYGSTGYFWTGTKVH